MATATPVKIRITEIVGSSICVSVEDATRLHDAIVKAFNTDTQVTLSFEGISRLTTAFLNSAVGQLYNEYSEDQVRKGLLPPEGASQEHLTLLKRVVDNAKLFFANQAKINAIVTETRGDD